MGGESVFVTAGMTSTASFRTTDDGKATGPISSAKTWSRTACLAAATTTLQKLCNFGIRLTYPGRKFMANLVVYMADTSLNNSVKGLVAGYKVASKISTVFKCRSEFSKPEEHFKDITSHIIGDSYSVISGLATLPIALAKSLGSLVQADTVNTPLKGTLQQARFVGWGRLEAIFTDHFTNLEDKKSRIDSETARKRSAREYENFAGVLSENNLNINLMDDYLRITNQSRREAGKA